MCCKLVQRDSLLHSREWSLPQWMIASPNYRWIAGDSVPIPIPGDVARALLQMRFGFAPTDGFKCKLFAGMLILYYAFLDSNGMSS